MTDDSDLLRRFVKQHCQAPFAELVERHIGLVYHAALRQTDGDTLLAEDAAQSAFTLLASKAASLLDHPELAGWLHTTACFCARELRRTETRRHQREQTAHAMHELHAETSADEAWARVRPLIDDALFELDAEDRTAVLLRHFEGRSYSEVGAALRLGENAARMRVDRALDRLQVALTKRGIVSSGTALAAVLAVPAALAVPAELAGKISGVALAGGVAAGVTGYGILHFMTYSKMVALASGVAAVIAVGTAVQQWNGRAAAQTEVSALQEEHVVLQAKVKELESRLATEAERVAQRERAQKLAAAKPAALAEAPAAPAPITHDGVEARFKKAQELARSGQSEEALREFLWCYDIGMRQVSSFSGVRNSFLVGALAKLGKTYPPALAALRERRDATEIRLVTSATDYDAGSDYGALNRALGEEDRTLVYFDSLPSDDRRRSTLGHHVADQLLEARRYEEIVQVMPYSSMMRGFETKSNLAPFQNLGASFIASHRRAISAVAAKNIEALAGGADLVQAREYVGKVVAFDNSPETRALLAKHLARAGHPELLAP